jgi:hypothetical protein
MDEQLRLWAINIDLFRQCFAAPPPLAETLREVTASLSTRGKTQRLPGLLSKLGPITRRPLDVPLIPLSEPTLGDGEAMMTSHYIESIRRKACWVLARGWLDKLATATITLDLPTSDLEELEFDLVRVGIPTRLSIRHLWVNTLDIPLRPTNDMTIGYTNAAVVPGYIETWTTALPEMEDKTRALATELLGFLTDHWGGYSHDPLQAQDDPTTAEDETPEVDDESPQAFADQGPLGLIAWWTSR